MIFSNKNPIHYRSPGAAGKRLAELIERYAGSYHEAKRRSQSNQEKRTQISDRWRGIPFHKWLERILCVLPMVLMPLFLTYSFALVLTNKAITGEVPSVVVRYCWVAPALVMLVMVYCVSEFEREREAKQNLSVSRGAFCIILITTIHLLLFSLCLQINEWWQVHLMVFTVGSWVEHMLIAFDVQIVPGLSFLRNVRDMLDYLHYRSAFHYWEGRKNHSSRMVFRYTRRYPHALRDLPEHSWRLTPEGEAFWLELKQP